jgi:hypothetical protein
MDLKSIQNGHYLHTISSLNQEGNLVGFFYFAQPELYQVPGLEFSAGPAITLLELDTEEIIIVVRFAILYPCLTVVAFKLKRNEGIGLNWLLYNETCA